MNKIKTKTGQDLKEMLVELSAYYYKQAKAADRDTNHPGENYEIGKIDGALEILDCVIFNLYGGKFTMENWMKNAGAWDERVAKILPYVYPHEDESEV